MTSNNDIDQCRIVYESHFEDVLKFTESQEQAVESCVHYYLNGKPFRKGFTALKCSSAFWDCQFWKDLPTGYYNSDPVA